MARRRLQFWSNKWKSLWVLQTCSREYIIKSWNDIRSLFSLIGSRSPKVFIAHAFKIKMICDWFSPFNCCQRFVHHGNLVYINHYGNIRKMSTWQRIKDKWRGRIRAFKKGQPFDGVFDHSMNLYNEKVNNVYLQSQK